MYKKEGAGFIRGFSDNMDSDKLVAGFIRGFSDNMDSDKLVAGFIKTRWRFL